MGLWCGASQTTRDPASMTDTYSENTAIPPLHGSNSSIHGEGSLSLITPLSSPSPSFSSASSISDTSELTSHFETTPFDCRVNPMLLEGDDFFIERQMPTARFSTRLKYWKVATSIFRWVKCIIVFRDNTDNISPSRTGLKAAKNCGLKIAGCSKEF